MAKDFLEEILVDGARKDPAFRQRVKEAVARRQLGRKLAVIREKKKLSQTVVAARMQTSTSVVSKFEAGGDVKLSTLQRYCAAVGTPVPLDLSPPKVRRRRPARQIQIEPRRQPATVFIERASAGLSTRTTRTAA